MHTLRHITSTPCSHIDAMDGAAMDAPQQDAGVEFVAPLNRIVQAA